MITDHPQETQAPITIRLSQPARDFAVGALLMAGGWEARSLFAFAYDYQLLMLVTVVACYIVASRKRGAW